jgi:hypothetical protein
MARDKKNLSPFMLWFEDAWEGWIRPLGLIFLLAIGYLLYKFELLGEQTAGIILVVGIVVGAIATGLMPAWPLARLPWQRAMLATLALAAAVATLYPTLHVAVPSSVFAEATLTADKPTATLNPGKSGPYDLTVAAHFKDAGRSDAEAGYSIDAKDTGGGSDHIEGEIKRQLVTIRSKKGGASSSIQERNESTHRLPDVRGAQVTLNGEGSSFDQLESGLKVELRRGSLSPIIFLVLGALALVMCVILDSRLVEPKSKVKSYLTASIGVAYVFAIAYPDEATPHALVRPAISSFLLALFVGGLSGWLLGGIARLLFGPKLPKKAAPAQRR